MVSMSAVLAGSFLLPSCFSEIVFLFFCSLLSLYLQLYLFVIVLVLKERQRRALISEVMLTPKERVTLY